ncbi:MAG TPA: (Fe-S)-binding protein [Thermotogota bacterium]|nr:(Fe-S)-binding protein [Thermotogota bacterium]
MINFLKKNKIIAVAIVAYLVTLIVSPDTFVKALQQNGSFLLEMLEVLPPVLVISSLITVWVPNEVIMKMFGKTSGIKGKLLSLLIGAFSAGPIYAGFPVTKTLFDKGASVGNVVIILSAWAVVKVPMYLVETSFLGSAFANTRYLLTIPFIILLGYLMQRFVKKEDIPVSEIEVGVEKIYEQLPKVNCGACGYNGCHAFAEAVFKGEVQMEGCKVLAHR